MRVWLTRKEVERLTGLHQDTILWYCRTGKWRVQEVSIEFGSAKKQYLIDLASLPGQAQAKWVEENLERAIELPEEYVRELCFEAASRILRAKANAKGGELSDLVLFRKQDKARKLVEICEKALKVPPGKTKAQWVREVAELYGVTERAVYKALKKYQEGGWRAFLRKKNTGPRAWSDEALKYMQGVYLKSLREQGENPSRKIAYQATLGKAKEEGWQVGSLRSAYEYLSKINPLLIKFAKGGERALDNIFYIPRYYGDLQPLEIIVGDQHRFNFFVVDEETGKVFRPEGYFWLDLRTRVVYGFSVMDRYNAYGMGLALRMGLKRFGLFQTAYTDNGKPELSKYMQEVFKEINRFAIEDIAELYRTQTGEYVIEEEEGEIVDVVKTSEAWHRRARVYNHKAKPIERFFQTLEQILVDMGVPGQVKNIKSTVEEKSVREEILKKLKDGGKLYSFEEFVLAVFRAVEEYNNRRHKTVGREPLEEMVRLYKKGEFVPVYLHESEIEYVLLAREKRKVHRGRIMLNHVQYEGEDIEAGLWDIPDGMEVEVRYDPYEGVVLVRRPDGKIVSLKEVESSSMKDREKTAELMARKRRFIKTIKALWQNLTKPIEGIIKVSERTKQVIEAKKEKKRIVTMSEEEFKREVAKKIEENKKWQESKKVISVDFKEKKFFKTDYERYKYLVDKELAGLELTQEEREFMRKYEASMSYEEKVWFENYKKYPEGGVVWAS